MNEVSIIINGVRYDAVMSDFPFSDCHDCAFFVSCTENNSCCNFLGENMQGMIFKKSDKKFEP